MKYWLMKNEPEDYSIDDLKRDKTEPWDGIRNYQVRNMIRDDMRIGDHAFFYHSNCETPGIYGQMSICKEAYVDHTAFDKKAKYYDPKKYGSEAKAFAAAKKDVGEAQVAKKTSAVIPFENHGESFDLCKQSSFVLAYLQETKDSRLTDSYCFIYRRNDRVMNIDNEITGDLFAMDDEQLIIIWNFEDEEKVQCVYKLDSESVYLLAESIPL